MNEVTFCNIAIQEIKDEGNRVVISDGKNKFSFFKTKQDGTKSKAQETFEQLQVRPSTFQTVGVTESEPQKFTNDKGQEITFTYHNIIGFYQFNQQNPPYQRPQLNRPPQAPTQTQTPQPVQTGTPANTPTQAPDTTPAIPTQTTEAKVEIENIPTSTQDEIDEVKIEDIPF